jgi:hypothetical protein
VDAGLGRQIGCSGCDGLDSRLFVVGDDRHSLDGFARLGGSLFQDLDLRAGIEILARARSTASIPATRSLISSFNLRTIRAVVSRSCRSSSVT